MHPEDIKSTLKKSGSSQAKIARALGVSVPTVFYVIQGVAKSRRVAKCISEVTGVDVDHLFPGKGYGK